MARLTEEQRQYFEAKQIVINYEQKTLYIHKRQYDLALPGTHHHVSIDEPWPDQITGRRINRQ